MKLVMIGVWVAHALGLGQVVRPLRATSRWQAQAAWAEVPMMAPHLNGLKQPLLA